MSGSREEIRKKRIEEFDSGKTPLRFTYFPPTEHVPYHIVNAHIGPSAGMMEERVGMLQWHPKTGETNLIMVDPSAQHRGIASAMWNEAMEKSKALGLVAPTGSSSRTEQGEQFFKKQGVELPPLKQGKYQKVNPDIFL